MDQPKKEKSKRPDTPLANTPEPLPIYLQTQAEIRAGRGTGGSLREIVEKRNAEKKAEKLANEAKERLNRTPTINDTHKMKLSDFVK
jgi:hypothetical protein